MRTKITILASTAMLLLASISALPPAQAQDTPSAKEGTFKARWVVRGTRQRLDFGPDREVFSFQIQGRLDVEADSGTLVDLQSKCVGMRDSKTGGMARCTWRDPDGDQIFSELSGNILGAQTTVQGTIVGGTGEYAGMQGDYSFTWSWQRFARAQTQEYFERQAPTLQGYATDLTGTWRLP